MVPSKTVDRAVRRGRSRTSSTVLMSDGQRTVWYRAKKLKTWYIKSISAM